MDDNLGRFVISQYKSRKHRINEEIIAERVRLVREEGDLMDVTLKEALEIARSKSLDLVEVSYDQDPPVVKTIDYSKFRFEQIKKSKESKKKQKVVHLKEIKMRPRIDTHDYDHKIKHARSFLEDGNKVKFTIMFRGREVIHSELGFEVMKNIEQDLKDVSQVEKVPAKEGRNITMIMSALPLSSKNK